MINDLILGLIVRLRWLLFIRSY